MNTKCDIEWYIHNKAERIRIATQAEAGQHKLDYKTFEHMVIEQLRAESKDYDDKYGTGGFVRFLARIIYDCRKNYDKLALLSKPIHHKIFEQAESMPTGIVKPEHINDISWPASNPIAIVKTIITKTCLQCGQAKDPDEFYNNKNMHGGKDSSCKECRKKAVVAKLNGLPKMVHKTSTVTKTHPDVTFTNEDLDFLIAQCQHKLEEAKDQADFWGKEFIRQTELIQKLERRKH
jgi:hypothetical protein